MKGMKGPKPHLKGIHVRMDGAIEKNQQQIGQKNC
jgi:hypothetical protein